MGTHNDYIYYRNTYYWSKNGCALGYGDYTKARIYHWLHTADLAASSGILESLKDPLENRVWYDYTGQSDPIAIGASSKPNHVGRVLDDGTTQLYSYAYNGFGQVTNSIDPVGRTFSYVYDTNGIDLLETRMTRAAPTSCFRGAPITPSICRSPLPTRRVRPPPLLTIHAARS